MREPSDLPPSRVQDDSTLRSLLRSSFTPANGRRKVEAPRIYDFVSAHLVIMGIELLSSPKQGQDDSVLNRIWQHFMQLLQETELTSGSDLGQDKSVWVSDCHSVHLGQYAGIAKFVRRSSSHDK